MVGFILNKVTLCAFVSVNGVPQGASLDPLVFLILVNSLQEKVTSECLFALMMTRCIAKLKNSSKNHTLLNVKKCLYNEVIVDYDYNLGIIIAFDHVCFVRNFGVSDLY